MPIGWEFIPVFLHLPIVNRVEWLWSPANVKKANKDDHVPWPCPIFCFVFVHYMYEHTKMFLLVSSSVWSKQLPGIAFCVQSRLKKQTKAYNKEINLSGFITICSSFVLVFWPPFPPSCSQFTSEVHATSKNMLCLPEYQVWCATVCHVQSCKFHWESWRRQKITKMFHSRQEKGV